MNQNDIEKIKDNYSANCSKIAELEAKISLLQDSGFEMKFSKALILSIIPWFALIFSAPSILKLIPLKLIKPLFILIPALIGTITSTIINKKQKIDEKVKEFSQATTTRKKLEQEARYRIEQEKLRSYNKILKKNYDDLKSNKMLFSSLSNKDNIAIEENVENIQKILNLKTNEMDIATTKYTLSKLFWKVRSKYDKYIDAFVFASIGMLFCTLFYNMPMFAENLPTGLLSIITPAIIGGIACLGYYFKRTSDKLSAFKNINNELLENSISENVKEKEDFEQEKNKIINDICVIKMQLYNEIQKLENSKNSQNNQQSVENNKEYNLDKKFVQKNNEILPPNLGNEKGAVLKKTLSNKNH